MEELLRTNDITVINVNPVLTKYINVFELVVNTSVLEGSIAILPSRLLLRSDELSKAQQLLRDHDVTLQ